MFCLLNNELTLNRATQKKLYKDKYNAVYSAILLGKGFKARLTQQSVFAS